MTFDYSHSASFQSNQEGSEIRPERLLTIYKMFASPSSHTLSLGTVVAFLQRKVKLNLLSLHNGSYRVVKDQPGVDAKV